MNYTDLHLTHFGSKGSILLYRYYAKRFNLYMVEYHRHVNTDLFYPHYTSDSFLF